jgi:hypothetical protein
MVLCACSALLDLSLQAVHRTQPWKFPFLPGLAYPWRCLCFAFSQITRTTPLRVITLHLTQIFFTDARTFICFVTLLRAQNPGTESFNPTPGFQFAVQN